MVVYPMKHQVGIKIAFDVINPCSRVDRNTPVTFRGKNVCICEEIGLPAPLRVRVLVYTSFIQCGMHNFAILQSCINLLQFCKHIFV